MNIRVIDRATRAVVYEGPSEKYEPPPPPMLPLVGTPDGVSAPPARDIIPLHERGTFIDAHDLGTIEDRTDYTVHTGDVEGTRAGPPRSGGHP